MAQGQFKLTAKPADKTRKKLQPKDAKKGAKYIPPKKAVVVAKQTLKKKLTSSHSSHVEGELASRAEKKGKLHLMKPTREEDGEASGSK